MSHFAKICKHFTMSLLFKVSLFLCRNPHLVTRQNVALWLDSCHVIAEKLWTFYLSVNDCGDFDVTLSNLVVSASRPQSACCWTFETRNKLSARRFERFDTMNDCRAVWEMCGGQSGWKSHGTIIDDEGDVHSVFTCGIRFAYWCLSATGVQSDKLCDEL